MTVVTYEAPANGSALPALLDVCRDCETRLVPRDGNGTEYCRVYRGAHSGECQHPEHGRGRVTLFGWDNCVPDNLPIYAVRGPDGLLTGELYGGLTGRADAEAACS